MPFPLETSRLVIAPLTASDVDAFVAYRQEPATARFQGWDVTYSREEAIELVGSQEGVQFPAEGEWLQLGIHNRKSGELLGDVAVHTVDESARRHEIGFTVARAYQGQGFAREAVHRVLELLFDEAQSEFVCATTDRRNVASIALLASLKFTQLPDRTWSEEFKGESVTVDYFELPAAHYSSR